MNIQFSLIRAWQYGCRVFLALALVLVSDLMAGPVRKIDLNRFIDPETCGGCHGDIMEQWTFSMHNLAHQDPVYNRVATFLHQGLTLEDEIKEADSCVKCHTPVGVISGFPEKFSDDLSKTPEIATQGISCDYCHSAVDVTKMYNNGLVLSPGHGEEDPGVKQGPFDDASSDFHETAFSSLHTDSRICGTCHDVKHAVFGTDLETTYTEWKNSPYNSPDPEKRITCQGCHMFQRPGVPATASTARPENSGTCADDGPERPHIFTHYFVGANTRIPPLFKGEKKAALAEARLTHAARISLDTAHLSDRKLGIIVANTGAGHDIPTGVGDLRQVWLEIIVRDANQKQLFASGVLDKKDELPEKTILFRTVLGDGQGNPVLNLAKARQVLSNTRIPAGKQVTRVIDLGFVPRKNSTITARLLYRGMPQKVLNLLPGPPVTPFPIVEMAAVSWKI